MLYKLLFMCKVVLTSDAYYSDFLHSLLVKFNRLGIKHININIDNA